MTDTAQTSELILPKEERLRLRSEAHHAAPAVLLGAAGLSEAAIREIDRALAAHGLVKVKAPAGPREEREQLHQQIAQRLQAARIQLIGRLMVLYRPLPKESAPAPKASSKKKRAIPKKLAATGKTTSRKTARRRAAARKFAGQQSGPAAPARRSAGVAPERRASGALPARRPGSATRPASAKPRRLPRRGQT
jgi:RNA-binding protein